MHHGLLSSFRSDDTWSSFVQKLISHQCNTTRWYVSNSIWYKSFIVTTNSLTSVKINLNKKKCRLSMSHFLDIFFLINEFD